MQERNITYEIKEHLGVIKEYETGWKKELNMISWNGAVTKYDIRDWDENHERMSRGITLHPGEMRTMVDLYIASNNRKALEQNDAEEKEMKKEEKGESSDLKEAKEDKVSTLESQK